METGEFNPCSDGLSAWTGEEYRVRYSTGARDSSPQRADQTSCPVGAGGCNNFIFTFTFIWHVMTCGLMILK
jgi:hypothetical protein